MEVSEQLHSQAALPPRKEHPVFIRYEAGWAPEPVWTRWQREKFPVTFLNGRRAEKYVLNWKEWRFSIQTFAWNKP
jgi:hypothetical protein